MGISKKSCQTYPDRPINDTHMIFQYPHNTDPIIPKRPTTPVTHPYISPVYMHCESIHTHIHIYTHTNIHTYTHAHIHTVVRLWY